ncbi:bifunctional (p)ppGpp synthetase/guanosine-3',5'-bis(diphosphate) 3'-pyrophosphohydrolase, partial [Candidatus Wolfebacteria bacterium]|nr:bifunctional (p)ppGpp synthetase/guanosine-3',5'-bis(diphosphate) 3'-pyrophosphohydrolase [Candidatus Wolfebacteria bacterium]
ENGIAAYWAYAESKTGKRYQRGNAIFAEKKETAWIKQLKEWQKEIPDSEEFIHSFKIDFLKDRIFVITPKGEVIDLPAGSTPVDFAYAIHSQIGDQTIGAKINGKIAPLDHQLQSGDLVEIMIQKSKKPSESWLEFIKTASARRKIKSAVHKKSRTNARLETEFKIIANDRIGLLKDLSSVISRSHINILKADVPKTDQLPIIKIRCAVNEKEKIEKLILKLKEIKGVKEISYKLV